MSTVNCIYSEPVNFEGNPPTTSLEVFSFSKSSCDVPDNIASSSAITQIDQNQFSQISDYQSLSLYYYAVLLFFVGYFVIKSMFDR